MSKTKKQTKKLRKFILWFWSIILIGILILVLIFSLIWNGKLGFMPSFAELENPNTNLASEIISADGVIIGKYYYENRTNITYEELSPEVVNALVATEDARFFEHSGIDFKALGRVFFGVITFSHKGGGSTISQQLAKNLFPRDNRNITELVLVKLKEWVVAVKLEKNYSKEEIIAMYFNTVFFGNNAYGIKAAANIFFDKEPIDLTSEEAALLVGILKAPSMYNPRNNYDKAIYRRNVVLHQMNKYNFINDSVYDTLVRQPINLSHFKKQDHTTGLAKHFRELVRLKMNEWCKTHYKADGSPYNLYSDGLKIYTTIDTRYQKHAEEAIEEYIGGELQPLFFKHWKNDPNAPFVFDAKDRKASIDHLMNTAMNRSERYRIMKKDGVDMDSIYKAFNTPCKMTVFSWKGEIDTVMTPMDSIRYYKHFIRTGLMSVEPHTGYVKAYACGPDYNYFQFDNISQMQRQVGSTFKPFVYTLAMQEGGLSPCSKMPNVQVSVMASDGKLWEPKNDSKEMVGEEVTLKWALAHSNNWISGHLIKRYGPEAVIEIARKMGVKSDIPPVYSIALGTADLSLYEMVGAMNTFVNKGVYIEPIYILKITDNNGNVLETFAPHQEEAVNEETAYLMVELMKGVVESGTGIRLRYRYGLNNPIAGKTGTTQNNSDGWFMGLTPNLVSGVWCGCEDRSAHFKTLALGQGANTALPVWAVYMTKLYNDKSINLYRGDFEKPIKPLSVETDCDKYDSLMNLNEKIINFDEDF
ncbi:MAG: transglycosylase domain-containing protein [Bacteroidales bacterium]|jgi:penicillin-binding protein 1A|nr:transglycosylase domain-containing protein [Bacteroidales bacterium]MDD2204574.1 transglycosylase domain-containing protein [Bacteroidales bacterium]MDD3151857.1 transglycosylase domain-containing protein [Bacteroidales bacterium]MDD3914395.1 transglycosylase domain-containing protein [Bacteroidales bacterium]MDD4633489.1 transglycosylase domain-containing protein [Bacteroidales bacterium]